MKKEEIYHRDKNIDDMDDAFDPEDGRGVTGTDLVEYEGCRDQGPPENDQGKEDI